jgi:hypothetical protein
MVSHSNLPDWMFRALTQILGALEVFFDSDGLVCSQAPKKAVIKQVEFAVAEYNKTLVALGDISQITLKRDWLILGVALHVLIEGDPESSKPHFQDLLNVIVDYLNHFQQYDAYKIKTWAISNNLFDKIRHLSDLASEGTEGSGGSKINP